MSIPGAASPLFIGAAAAADAGYQIDRSLRFNAADSAYLNRTPSSAGNRKTWTISFWVKSPFDGTNAMRPFFTYGSGASGGYVDMQFTASGVFQMSDWTTFFIQTSSLYRDPSAWYHFVVAVDTTQSTAANRVKLYVNGVEVTKGGSDPSLNYEFGVNNNQQQNIGAGTNSSNAFSAGSNFYLAEYHLVDGQQLDESDFGELDENNNWNPKEYSGSYGTNGFHLDFKDNSSNAALGYDANGTVRYHPDVTGTGISSTVKKLFDGSIATTVDGTAGTVITFTPSAAISYSSSVEVYTASSQTTRTYSLNGGSGVTNVANGWTSLATGSGTITSISQTPNSGYTHSWSAIRVDGTILTDPNDWTVNNFSVASGSGNDSLIDTPTNYTAGSGNNGGNYATLNPINLHSDITLSNGNLQIAKTNNAYRSAFSTIGASSGKWYFEVKPTANANEGMFIGIDQTGDPSRYIGQINGSNGFSWKEEGNFYQNDSNSSYGGSGYATNDIIGVAADLDNGTLTFYKNNTSQGTATSSLPSGTYFFGVSVYHSSTTAEVNYGSRPFAYTPPTGYVSLCTQNLADPTIADGSTAMDVAIWSGNSTARDISGLNMSPDLVWIKKRNSATFGNHQLFDAVRGATKALVPNDTQGENTETTQLTAFNSDGFSLGASTFVNATSNTYVGWSWDGGTSTASNTDGSITSNVRANQSAGFSIVSYNGDNNAGDTVGHGLNATPEWIIIKNRDASFTWYVYHSAIGATKYLRLDTTNSETTGSGAFNNTAPTSSVFSLGQDNAVNDGNKNYIAYCWAPVSGYSSFGAFTGNGSSEGPFVYTGFRPKWIMVKRYDGNAPWVIADTERNTFNVIDNHLLANDSAAENGSTIGNICDSVSNGFKFRGSDGWFNGSSANYIYAAFAEHPFKTARAR